MASRRNPSHYLDDFGFFCRATYTATAVAVVLLASSPALAATVSWTGPSGGSWSNGGNWSGAAVPTSGDDVVIDANVSVIFDLSTPASINSLVLGNNSGTSSVELTSLSGGSSAIDIAIAGDFTVYAGASVTAIGKGYPGGGYHAAGQGPGGGEAALCGEFVFDHTRGSVSSGGGGGGHGRPGGAGYRCAGGGQAYDSILEPVQAGSGGGWSAWDLTNGGNGGGRIMLTVGGTAAIFGNMSVDGTAPNGCGGGGGAGGTINLKAQTFSGTGTIQARGVTGGGGGAGGRVSLKVNVTTFAGTIDTAGSPFPVCFGFQGGAGSAFYSLDKKSYLVDVASTSIQLDWSADAGPGGTDYVALARSEALLQDITTQGTLPSVVSSSVTTQNTYASLDGIEPNTTYYIEIEGVAISTVQDNRLVLVSTVTRAAVPANPAFINVTRTELTLSWEAASNPLGTIYRAQISTASDFSAIMQSSDTVNLSVEFLGLDPLTTYYGRVQAINHADTKTFFVSTSTSTPFLLAPGSQPFGAVSANSITVQWLSLGNPADTAYIVSVSTSDQFDTLVASESVQGTSAIVGSGGFGALDPNVRYFFGVIASSNGYTTQRTEMNVPTLANPPVNTAVIGITAQGFTINWDANGNSTSTVYEFIIGFPDTNQDGDPDGQGAGSLVATSTTTQDYFGIVGNSDYSVQVRAVNLDGIPTDYDATVPVLTAIETPTSVAFEDISTTSVVAAPFAQVPGFSRFSIGQSGANLAKEGNYAGWNAGDTWTSKSDAPTARLGAAAAFVNGRLYVFGGQDNSGITNIVEEYDPASDSWATKAPLPSARAYSAAVALRGKIYLLGGRNYNSETVNLNEEYDPTTDSWTSKTPMPTPRAYLSAAAVNGKIFAMGGSDSSDLSVNEAYDPDSNTWTTKTDAPNTRYSGAAAAVNGRIYLMGGYVGPDGNLNGTNEEYDPLADSWLEKSSMPTPRSGFGFVALGSKLYAIGGEDDSDYWAITEEYDPSNDKWAARSDMQYGSRTQVAAAAGGGKIYIAGGTDGDYVYALDQYDPVGARLFDGLLPNASYDFKALARNANGDQSAESSQFTIRTLAAIAFPEDGRSTFTAVAATSVIAQWSSGTALGGFNASGARYLLQASSNSAFASITASSDTADISAEISGLTANIPYHFRVRATNNDGVAGEFLALGATFYTTDTVAPAAVTSLVASEVNVSSVALQWSAPTDDVAVFSYEIRWATFTLYASNFPSATLVTPPTPAVPGSTETVIIQGLQDATTFFAALKSRDAAGNVSALSNVASFVRSTTTVDGYIEATFSASQPVSINIVPTDDSPGNVVIASATGQGLVLVSNIYDLGPEGATFNPAAVLVFHYSAGVLTDLGLTPEDIRIYQFISGTGLVPVSTQTLNSADQSITAYLTSLSSIFAVFGRPPSPFVLNPSTGPIGIPFTISGSGFGSYAGANTRVKFGVSTAPVTVWNDSTVSGTVPGLSTGSYPVTLERQHASSTTVVTIGDFQLTDLSSATLSVSSGPIGLPFSFLGSGFGPYAGALTRVLVGETTAPISVWSDGQISGTIPGVSSGPLQIVIQRAASGGGIQNSSPFAFEVTLPSVTAVNPASGPIGAAFTLTGYSFGSFAGANTRVLLGGATTPISVWNDSTITATVPGGLTPGAYELVVERRTSDGGLAQSNTVYFQVAALSVSVLNPSTGPIGVPFTISGAGFGAYAGVNTQVLFGETTSAISVWNDATISGTIPALSTGAYDVVVKRVQGAGVEYSNASTFTLTALTLATPTPSSAPIGAPFTLTGTGFGPYAGANTRLLLGGATVAVSVWNDSTITGSVPPVPPGSQPLWIERRSGVGLQASNTVYFEVLTPSVTAVSPSSGPIGALFTLTGAGFGPYAGVNTRVLLGGATTPISVWNDTMIKGTVPGLVPTGVQPLVVERTSGGGLSQSNTVYFEVTGQSISAINPSTGPVGIQFTITGTSFGSYAGVNTQVLFGQTTAAISLWNDTTIKGTIPALATGAYTVSVERIQGAGVSLSNAASFTLTELTLSVPVPSSAPAGAPFTLTGTGFGAYAGANTRLLLGGATVPVSVWNDTTITGTVLALTPGTYPLWIERLGTGGLEASNTVYFQILAPTVGSLNPSTGPIGVPFTITGSGFGPYSGANTQVLFGAVAAPISVWNDSTIKGTVPALSTGTYDLVVQRVQGGVPSISGASSFTVLLPQVAAMTPSSAPIGAPFTITGTAFGPYAGASTRVKFNGIAAPISVWNDATISGTVPGAVAVGSATVVVERAVGAAVAQSAEQSFLVLQPTISTITPSYGPVGTVVTLTGSGFGPYAGTATKLLVSGSTVAVSVWNNTTIRWTVPASLGDGVHPVVAVRQPAGGYIESNSMDFTVGTGYGGSSFGFTAEPTLAARPDTHFEGGLNLPVAEGGRVETPSKAAVDVPPNALEEDAEITLKRLHRDGLRSQAAEAAKVRAAGEAIEFGPEGTRFTTPVTIELPYDPALTADESKLAVHYYDPLRRVWEELPSEVDRARHVVKAKTTHFSIYQPMGLAPTTAAQDEFYFRDQYAFPNPSRGNAAVTFRIQPGLADTVEVRVYDVSGRKIHYSSDFTFRGAIDDGNGKGAQNTYDHTWNVSGVGSGVYTFVIKASRAGQSPINKSGKVGVIK